MNATALGPVVMSTGIMSVVLSLDGRRVASRVLLILTAAQWLVLCVFIGRLLLSDRASVRRRSSSPEALSVVAGMAVLGTRVAMLGASAAAIALLALAGVLWAALLVPVLSHWRTPTVGVSLLLTVSTEALAVLLASVAAPAHAHWLLPLALVPFVVGLAFYVLVILRFDFRQLAVGRGDHWITGGALAISTLAVARIAVAGRDLHALIAIAGFLKAASIALWVLAILWLPLLVAAELRWRRFAYHAQRWSTVFPVGMYAACSFMVAAAADAPAIRAFARVWAWVGLAVWVLVGAAMIASANHVAAGTHRAGLFDGHDLAAERKQRNRDQLEVGQAQRDPDDRQAQRNPGEEVTERQPPSAQHQPDHISDSGADAGVGTHHDGPPERP